MKKTLNFVAALAFGSASENSFLPDNKLLSKPPKDFTHMFADDELGIKNVIKKVHHSDDELLVRDPRDSMHIFADDELTIKRKMVKHVYRDDELFVRNPKDSMHISADDELSSLSQLHPRDHRKPGPERADNSLYRFGGNLVQNWHYPLKPINPYVPRVENKPEEKFAQVESVEENMSSRVGDNLVKNWHYPIPRINTFVPVENKPKVEEETHENALFTLKDRLKEAGKKNDLGTRRRILKKNFLHPLPDVKRESQNS